MISVIFTHRKIKNATLLPNQISDLKFQISDLKKTSVCHIIATKTILPPSARNHSGGIYPSGTSTIDSLINFRKMNTIKSLLAAGVVVAAAFFQSCQKDDSGSNSNIPDVRTDYTVASVLAANGATHEASDDYSWDASSEMSIVLNGTSMTTTSPAVNVNGTKATITAPGNYTVSGTLSDGQIVVETTTEGTVRLILNNATINNSSSAAIFVSSATKTILVLKDGTENTLTDGSVYIFATATDTEPDATLFAKDELTIYGNGTLTVKANYKDAIACKDGIVIAGGTLKVTAKDDGIRGKDYLVAKNTSITINAGGDGLKSTNDTDASLGFVYIASGNYNITSGADAVQAVTDVLVENGAFTLTSGGGSGASGTVETAKGLKAGSQLVIDNGEFNLSTADDALHSNNNLTINEGDFTIASKDDGIHADTSLSINGGKVLISKSYEGIESRAVVINGGEIHLTSSDDGVNAAGGNDGSASQNFPGASSSSSDYFISVNGGYLVVNATGDGLDANGSLAMTGGTVIVNGPTAQNNGPLDYDVSFQITGGVLIAVGSSGMAQAPDNSSTQNSVLVKFSGTRSAGDLIHIQSASGDDVLTFKPAKSYQSLAFSAPALQKGSYTIYNGGSSSGEAVDGLYSGGTYTAGTVYADFTVSGVVTKVQ